MATILEAKKAEVERVQAKVREKINRLVPITTELIVEFHPTRKEGLSEEEYQIDFTNMQLSIIEIVREYKEILMQKVMLYYNEHIIEPKRKMPSIIKKQERAVEKQYTESVGGIAGFMTAIALLAPTGILNLESLPENLVICLLWSSLLLRLYDQKETRYKQSKELCEGYEDLQISFFEYIERLKQEYRNTNNELDILEEKAKRGQNILEELMDLIVSLTKWYSEEPQKQNKKV